MIERVLTDNAKAYHSHLWRDTCATLEIGRRSTSYSPSPWTHGKAEALIKTLLREWASRFAYATSAHRARTLNGYLRWYNRRRPHSSLGGQPPTTRDSHLCGQYGYETRARRVRSVLTAAANGAVARRSGISSSGGNGRLKR